MSITETRKEKLKEPINTMSVRDVKPHQYVSSLPAHERLKVFTSEFKIEYDYLQLLNNDKAIIKLYNKKCRINIIISVYNRDKYIHACINALEYAIFLSNLSVKITIIQIEDIPTLQKYAKQKKLDYIFLHINNILTENQFSKALAYDIAYLLGCNMSETTLFHDCDLIVTDNFFNVLDEHYLNTLSWLQTFCDKSVIPINYEDTIKILNNDVLDSELTHFLDSKNPHLDIRHKNKQSELDYKMVTGGACGGSILIKNSLYEQVGGMDPEICYGYTIEDAMLWTKLITTKKIVNRVNTVHQTDHEYAQHPVPLYQYHLYHLSPILLNKHYKLMSDMQMEFLHCVHKDKLSYILMKKEQFAENKKIIEENFNV